MKYLLFLMLLIIGCQKYVLKCEKEFDVSGKIEKRIDYFHNCKMIGHTKNFGAFFECGDLGWDWKHSIVLGAIENNCEYEPYSW